MSAVGTGLAERGPVSTIKTSLKRSNGFLGPFLDKVGNGILNTPDYVLW